jgi:DDE superfamily endonuclease
MLTLRHRSRQIVVTDEELNGTDMVDELLGKRQCVADQPCHALPQHVIEPGEIISHGVWLYYHFTLSYRAVQELLFERGITVSHEAIRTWRGKFLKDYANQLRRRRPRPGYKRHLDEVFLTIQGKRHYLWRAVDQDDNVLDILVQSRRNKKTARN